MQFRIPLFLHKNFEKERECMKCFLIYRISIVFSITVMNIAYINLHFKIFTIQWLYLFILCICLYVLMHMCDSQQTHAEVSCLLPLCGSWGNKFRMSDLVAISFTH